MVIGYGSGRMPASRKGGRITIQNYYYERQAPNEYVYRVRQIAERLAPGEDADTLHELLRRFEDRRLVAADAETIHALRIKLRESGQLHRMGEEFTNALAWLEKEIRRAEA